MAGAGDVIRSNIPEARPSQSVVIFGALIFAFFVFITIRGDLPKWRAIFGI